MANFKPHKIVSQLPTTLEADSVYYVRVGEGFDLYVTNNLGEIKAYRMNLLYGRDFGETLGTDIIDRDAGDRRFVNRRDVDTSIGSNVQFQDKGTVEFMFWDPGVGGTQRLKFNRASDKAGIEVTEPRPDNTYISFYMADNPDEGDYYSWRFDDWTGPNGTWEPIKIGALRTRFMGAGTDLYGGITQYTAPYFTCNDGNNSVVVNNYDRLKIAGTSSLKITNIDMTNYIDGDGRTFWVQFTSTTQFNWGWMAPDQTPIQSGLVKAAVVTLGNGLKLSMSGNAAVGDTFHCRLWKAPSNAFGATGFTGPVVFNGTRPRFGAATIWDSSNLPFAKVTRSTNYTAKDGDVIFADTSVAGWTLTLPAFGIVEVIDSTGTWPTKNLTVIGNIRGSVGNLVCDQTAALKFTRPQGTTVWTVVRSLGINP